MNGPDTFSALLRHSQRYEDKVLFLRQDGQDVSFARFSVLVRSISAVLLRREERFVLPQAEDECLYAAACLACVVTGHVACLGEGEAILSLPGLLRLDGDSLRRMAGQAPVPFEALPGTPPDGLCAVALSSGTASGRQRAVGLSQRNLLLDAQAGMQFFRYDETGVCVHILPYWHLFGLVTELLAPLLSGACVGLPDSPLRFFSFLRACRPTFLHLTPAVASRLAELVAASGADGAGGRLEKLMCAGAPLDGRTFDTLTAAGIKVCMAYGLTECSPCVSLTPEDDIRRGASGKILPGVEVRLGQDGEICVRGGTVMLGYLDGQGRLQPVPRDGWLHTGDLGSLSADGFLTVLGRKSSTLVFSNGIKCVPEQLEQELCALEGVVECLADTEGSGAEQLPRITLVCGDTRPDPEEVRRVMERAGLPVFRCRIQREALKRNEMGKLIR